LTFSNIGQSNPGQAPTIVPWYQTESLSGTGKPNTGVGAYTSSTYPPRIIGFDARIEF
jgi:hypothetical protein